MEGERGKEKEGGRITNNKIRHHVTYLDTVSCQTDPLEVTQLVKPGNLRYAVPLEVKGHQSGEMLDSFNLHHIIVLSRELWRERERERVTWSWYTNGHFNTWISAR